MTKRNDVCVKVYFSKDEFLEMIKRAEKAGKRPRGLIPYKQKKHGFANETSPNRKGLSKFLKYATEYWSDKEEERLREAAEVMQEEKRINERKKKLGIISLLD
jgi:hypothetical protein